MRNLDPAAASKLNLVYRLKQIDIDGALSYSQEVEVKAEAEEIPAKFVLYQNYPKPFNSSTTIKYSIPANSVISTGGRNLEDFSSS